jgi:hypothetical protein
MADQTYMEELLAQESGNTAQVLLGAYKAMVRDKSIDPQEYPMRLRQVMDRLLQELVDAPAEPDRP